LVSDNGETTIAHGGDILGSGVTYCAFAMIVAIDSAPDFLSLEIGFDGQRSPDRSRIASACFLLGIGKAHHATAFNTGAARYYDSIHLAITSIRGLNAPALVVNKGTVTF